MGLVNRAYGRGRFLSCVIIYQVFNEEIKIILKLYLLYVCVHTCLHAHIIHVEARRQFAGAGSILLPCKSWKSNLVIRFGKCCYILPVPV